MRFRNFILLAIAGSIAFLAIATAQKKKKEEETQSLQVPKDLPASMTGDPRRFTFQATPLSSKGLLSQQIRDALKALSREAGSDTVLHIRAFVAGSGDLRRVRDLVSEHFADRRQPLPVLSLIQSGGLPMEGAQVVLESISAARKEVNPNGVVLLSPALATSARPVDPVAPLMEKSLDALRRKLKAAGSDAADMLRVTCFVSSLEDHAALRRLATAEYPKTPFTLVQTQRAPFEALAACEGAARVRSKAVVTQHFVNAEEAPRDLDVTDAVLLSEPSVVLTGTQISFGYQEPDSRLAFDRLRKLLEQAATSTRSVVYARYYPLAPSIAGQVRKIRTEVFGANAHPPGGYLLLFEGLPSMDAGFAVDVIAVKEK